jgi:predicted nucleotidyltransferase
MQNDKLNRIIEILINEVHPKKLILFGSRGKGIESYNSDYDIAIDSGKISRSDKRKLKEKLDEIIGLHKIDLVYINEVDQDFTNIIQETGKVIYEK